MKYLNYVDTIRYSVKRIEDFASNTNQNFEALLNQVFAYIAEINNNQQQFDSCFNSYCEKYF